MQTLGYLDFIKSVWCHCWFFWFLDGGKLTRGQGGELAMLWLHVVAPVTWGLVGTSCSCPPPICCPECYKGNEGQTRAARLCSESWGTPHPTENARRTFIPYSSTQNTFKLCEFIQCYVIATWITLIILVKIEAKAFKESASMLTEQLDTNVEHVNIQYGVFFVVFFPHKEKQKGLLCLWAVLQDCGTSGGPGLDRPGAAPAG